MEHCEGIYSADGEEVSDPNSDDYLDTPNELHELLPFLVDPTVIFGTDTTLVNPSGFFSKEAPSLRDLMKAPQGTTSRTPCAYAGASVELPPGGKVVLTSVYGHAQSLSEYIDEYAPKLRRVGYVREKRAAASALVAEITSRVITNTSSSIFNQYVQQNFLDNVLRGGLPVRLGGSNDNAKALTSEGSTRPKIYHVFSRIHGDLERDYNNFNIDTTYFSQGPGNFRDVNQNRRNDVIYSPEVGDFNVRMFLTFIQTDGFNPLTVASTLFSMTKDSVDRVFPRLGMHKDDQQRFTALVTRGFRIGQLLKDMKAAGITVSIDRNDFVETIMVASTQTTAGQYAQNGFWTDHWTYTLDLINSFLYIFPDKEVQMMYDADPIPFFMSPAIVKPRDERYVLVNDPQRPGQKTVRVYSAVSAWGELNFPAKRMAAMNRIYVHPSYVVGQDGAASVWQRCVGGEVFKVAPITKLAMLAILKFSTMDPLGMGVEMEGGKPGWNDAMNGLPGIIGSEMSETYEMLQIVRYLQGSLSRSRRDISFPVEFSEFMGLLAESLELMEGKFGHKSAEFKHWSRSNDARERYRREMIGDVKCEYEVWSAKKVLRFLDAIELKTTHGISRALATNNGLPPTYFYYECTDYSVVPVENINTSRPAAATGLSNSPSLQKEVVRANSFELNTLPLFLEGPTRHMKTIHDVDSLQRMYLKVKESDIYDTNLKMFKISGSLVKMRQEIGRMMAFSPGEYDCINMVISSLQT